MTKFSADLKKPKLHVVRRKVLIDLFQKVAGVEGTESPIDLRRGRNSLDFMGVPLFGSWKERSSFTPR